MITNVLVEHSALVPVVLVLIALGCVGVGWLVLRGRHGQRGAWVLAGLSVLPVPRADSRPGRRQPTR